MLGHVGPTLNEKEMTQMKKNKAQRQRPRRLSLNRETIRSLNDPALVELARGGTMVSELKVGCPDTYSVSAAVCRSEQTLCL